MKQNTLIGLLVLLMFVFVAFLGYKEFIKPQQVQPVVPGQPAPAGYTPFPLGTLAIYVKDANNPNNAVTTATVKGKVYDIGVSNVASPLTPYLDSATNNNGALSFQAKKVLTGTSYKVKIWDDSASPAWYAQLVTVNIPALDPSLGANAQYTAPDVLLEKIGTFADPMQVEATGAGGGSLQTGVTSSASTNTVTINKTQVTDSSITIRFQVTFANTGIGSKLKQVVFRPIQDQTNPMPTNAFTGATFTYISGSNLGLPGDVLSYVTSQQPIALGDWTDSTSATYYFQVTLDKASLANGQTFYFRIDDLGNWLATDPIDGSSGASSQYIKITVVV
jgi:hypothetical protein